MSEQPQYRSPTPIEALKVRILELKSMQELDGETSILVDQIRSFEAAIKYLRDQGYD